jgi:hypothetical protein
MPNRRSVLLRRPPVAARGFRADARDRGGELSWRAETLQREFGEFIISARASYVAQSAVPRGLPELG